MKLFGFYISYKQLNVYLGWGLLPLLFIVYNLSISKSLELVASNAALERNIANSSMAPQKIKELEKKAARVDVLFTKYFANNSSDREYILAMIGEFCYRNRLLVYKVPEASNYEANGYQVETFEFAVQGGYLSMVRLLDHLESQGGIGKVASVKFETVKDLVTKSNMLLCRIYLQRIIVNENDLH